MSDKNTDEPTTTTEQADPGPGLPPGAKVVGELTEGERNTLASFQQAAGNILQELGRIEASKIQMLVGPGDVLAKIGEMEVSKARLLGNYQDIEGKAQGLLNNAAKRMAIPEGQRWQVGPEGKAVVLPQPPQTPQAVGAPPQQ
jgi:hypothetical protein